MIKKTKIGKKLFGNRPSELTSKEIGKYIELTLEEKGSDKVMSEETRKILKELEVGTTYSGVDVICRQYKEIERLNNIINELEKYIRTEVDYIEFVVDPILDKLQELKGDDSNE